MRFRFKPTAEQRAALQEQLTRLHEPAAVVEVLASSLPTGFEPASVSCAVPGAHSDRFVMQVQLRSTSGEERGYALKVYSDDFGSRVWAHAQALAQHLPPNHDSICLPGQFIPQERMLLFPWVDGRFLSEIVDDRKPELLRRAARLAAALHRLPIVPESLTTAAMIVDETRARCGRLRRRVPATAPIVAPLLATLQEMIPLLDPAEPAPVHGDLAAGQFLWTGDRLVLLDLDMFGYADPAYDAGHFLAQLERRCLWDRALPAHASTWVACFRDAYLAAIPTVSPRNVAFYQAVTLVRKMYTICRREPTRWPELVPQFASRARAALEQVAERTP
jgi:hypothetical protein